MTLNLRECNIENDIRSGYPEHELMMFFKKFHSNSIVRCMKIMQKQ